MEVETDGEINWFWEEELCDKGMRTKRKGILYEN